MTGSLPYEHRTTDIGKLIPYAANSRTHSDEQVSQIAASIREWGFTNPVLIDEKNTIIAGHCRVMAAKKLELKEVPCIVLEGLTDGQKKAYVLADNKLALNADWDYELLAAEVKAINDLDFDAGVIGFDSDELFHIENGWVSDLELPEPGEEDGLIKIGVRVERDQEDHAIGIIKEALQSAGVVYE